MPSKIRTKQSLACISLTDEEKKHLMSEIEAFYLDERGEEIGIIHQQQLLDLFLEKLAPAIIKHSTTLKSGMHKPLTIWNPIIICSTKNCNKEIVNSGKDIK